MTERTVKATAREIAGVFYDQNRSERFRKVNPSQRQFVKDNWPSFVDLARKQLVQMLTLPGTHQHIKDAIYDAIIQDNRQAHSGNAVYVPQATLEPVEKEDRKMVDDNPQLIISKG